MCIDSLPTHYKKSVNEKEISPFLELINNIRERYLINTKYLDAACSEEHEPSLEDLRNIVGFRWDNLSEEQKKWHAKINYYVNRVLGEEASKTQTPRIDTSKPYELQFSRISSMEKGLYNAMDIIMTKRINDASYASLYLRTYQGMVTGKKWLVWEMAEYFYRYVYLALTTIQTIRHYYESI